MITLLQHINSNMHLIKSEADTEQFVALPILNKLGYSIEHTKAKYPIKLRTSKHGKDGPRADHFLNAPLGMGGENKKSLCPWKKS